MQIQDLDLSNAIDLSIHLANRREQPGFFGAMAAETTPFPDSKDGMDTRRGASCNVTSVKLTPHCNGTHTECVGHITEQRIHLMEFPPPVWQNALLVSARHKSADTTDDELPDYAKATDKIIDEAASSGWDKNWPDQEALIIRTLPNTEAKTSRQYKKSSDYPYCSPRLMRAIAQSNVKHLLIDTPSIDRMFDQGRLGNHRLFWGLDEGDKNYTNAQYPERTITEMIYVPETAADGRYWLNLQLMPYKADAVPSRPVIFAHSAQS